MDDKTRGVGGDDMAGRGEDYITGREGTTKDALDKAWSPSGAGARRAAEDTTRGYATPGSGDVNDAVTDERTRVLRRDIERTREDMSDTVEAIQDRLRPATIVSNAAESVKNTAKEKAYEVAESEPVQYVRANPIPAAMVGIGIAGAAWLAFAGRDADRIRSRSDREERGWGALPDYDQRYYRRPVAGAAAPYESAGPYSPGMSNDTSGESITSKATEVAGDVRRRTEQLARRTQSQLHRAWNESPLLIGAVSAVAGVLVALAIPETERENRLLGETRDSVVEGVQQTVREKVNQVQDAAKTAVGLTGEGTTSPGSTGPQR